MSGRGSKARRAARREARSPHIYGPLNHYRQECDPLEIGGQRFCRVTGRLVVLRWYDVGRHARWVHPGDPFPPPAFGC